MTAFDGRLRPSAVALASLLTLAASGVACSADAVTVPEPALETPGAFIAWVDASDDELRLFRMVAPASFGPDDLLLLGILYAARPENFEHARELAQTHDLPEQVHQYFVARSQVVSQPHEVVWFRTLRSADISPVR